MTAMKIHEATIELMTRQYFCNIFTWSMFDCLTNTVAYYDVKAVEAFQLVIITATA